MSGGTFTDENGQVYVVDPETGQLTPVRGSKKKPGLSELAKPVVDESLKSTGKAIAKAAEGKLLPALGLASVMPGSAAGAAAGGLAGTAGAAAPGIAGAAAGATDLSSAAAGALGGGAATGFFTGNGLLSSGAMGVGDYIPGVAGAIGLYDLSQNRERIGTGAGYLEGAASGAGIGYTVGGPIGAGIGAGIGLLGNAFGIGHKSRTKGEEHAREALAEQGIVIPNSDIKEWENNETFKKSRQESDLTGKDIIHAADFYGIQGYDKLEAAKQEAIANKALELGLIREKLGKINLGHSAELDAFIQSQLGGGGVSGPSREAAAEAKRNRKRAALAQIMPELNAPVTTGPRYDLDPSALIKNPYL